MERLFPPAEIPGDRCLVFVRASAGLTAQDSLLALVRRTKGGTIMALTAWPNVAPGLSRL